MKKALSLMLVLVMVLGMSTVAFAAADKIDKNHDNRGQVAILDAVTGDERGDWDVEVQKGNNWTSDIINFSSVLPSWAPADETKYGTSGLTEEGIKYNRITLKSVFAKGASKAIDEVKFVYASKVNNKNIDAKVAINFNDDFTSNKEGGIEYQVKVYLVVDGRQWADSGFTLSGDYYNDTSTYYEATDGSVYMADGVIIKADGYMKNVEMDLGEGVFAYGKMFKDRCYYGKADIDVYDADEDFFDKYELDAVYHVKEAGLKAVVEYIKLENEDSSSYVYYVDADGNLVDSGLKGNDKLELRDTYYLSTKYIELESNDEAPIDDEGDGYEEVPGTGGDDYYPENVNDNPGTGR